MFETILLIIFCHLVGDYVLQSDFIAKTKGSNWYHLFVHCGLYIFAVLYSFRINVEAWNNICSSYDY